MSRRSRKAGRAGSEDPLGADLRDHQRRLRQVLRARSRPRHAGQHRRGGRRHRRAVDRRAGHPAHDAYVPHRRRGADQRAVVHRVELRRQGDDQEQGKIASQEQRRRSGSPWAATWWSPWPMPTAPSARPTAFSTARGCRVDEGDDIKRGQRIAEWDPYTRPILTEVEGTIGFEDLVEGQSMSETLDESTGIAKRVVIDWRTARGGADLRPAIVIKGKDGKILKLARGGEARYLLSVDAILSVDPARKVKAGDVIARIPTESAKTRDITGGLPRVAELFEARRPKEAAIIAEISGTIRFGKDYKNKRRITIEPNEKGAEPRVPDPEGQAHPSAGRRHHREGRLHRRGQSGAARHPGDQGRRGARRLSWSTRSRRSTGCRACRSTTSTSR